jgi:hypothetical protein
MPNTFELIASSTVGSGGASTIDFTSIPSTYTDLCFKMSVRTTRSNAVEDLLISLNGNNTGMTNRNLFGDGANATSSSQSGANILTNGNTSTASTFGSFEVYIPNYAGSANKSFSIDAVSENNSITAYAEIAAFIKPDSAAINRVTFQSNSGSTFLQHSSAYLYGVKNA